MGRFIKKVIDLRLQTAILRELNKIKVLYEYDPLVRTTGYETTWDDSDGNMGGVRIIDNEIQLFHFDDEGKEVTEMIDFKRFLNVLHGDDDQIPTESLETLKQIQELMNQNPSNENATKQTNANTVDAAIKAMYDNPNLKAISLEIPVGPLTPDQVIERLIYSQMLTESTVMYFKQSNPEEVMKVITELSKYDPSDNRDNILETLKKLAAFMIIYS